jgi:hypothetical protein
MLCAALVLVLTLLAASPAAHLWVHSVAGTHTCPDHPAPEPVDSAGEHDCAVVLFASGVDTPVAAIMLVPPRVVAQDNAPANAAEVFLVSPRYLRQPERGPPASRVA